MTSTDPIAETLKAEERLGLSTLKSNGLDLPDFFSGQFIISPNTPYYDFGSWRTCSTSNWYLQVGPDMPAGHIMDQTGKVIGLFIGIGVDANGNCLNGDIRLAINSENTNALPSLERYFSTTAGRFIALLDFGHHQLLLQDPVGDCAAVFNPDTKVTASTLLLALNREIDENLDQPYDLVRTGKIHHILSETRDRRVRRLIPNHALDLTTFQTYRIWPRPNTDLDPHKGDPIELVHQISQRLTQITDSLTGALPCILPISSGRDARNLIGCARPFLNRIELSYTHSYDRSFRPFGMKRHKIQTARRAAEIACEIARRIKLPHEVITKTPNKSDLSEYPYRTGFVPNAVQSKLVNTYRQLPKGRVALLGNVMELLRANQWRRWSIERAPSQRHALNFRLKQKFNTSRAMKPKYEEWSTTFAPKFLPHLYEIQFLEHVLPNTLGTRHYATSNTFFLNPFADRNIIELALRLPLKYRRSGQANLDFLGLVCPDLADIELI